MLILLHQYSLTKICVAFFFFKSLIPAIAELLDNAVDEVDIYFYYFHQRSLTLSSTFIIFAISFHIIEY